MVKDHKAKYYKECPKNSFRKLKYGSKKFKNL